MIAVFDIDGTLSKMSPERLALVKQRKKDWDKFYSLCFDDEPHWDIIGLAHQMQSKHTILFCTGRRESVREITLEWLRKHFGFDIPSESLLMRPDGDKRSDTEVKPEILADFMCKMQIPNHFIEFIFEDRDGMVKKWRELGYRCLQVQSGDF